MQRYAHLSPVATVPDTNLKTIEAFGTEESFTSMGKFDHDYDTALKIDSFSSGTGSATDCSAVSGTFAHGSDPCWNTALHLK